MPEVEHRPALGDVLARSGTWGIPWRLGGPLPSGLPSAAAGVAFILSKKRARSFIRASTMRRCFSSFAHGRAQVGAGAWRR